VRADLVLHPLARLDLIDAVGGYEDQQPGLGLSLADEVEHAMGGGPQHAR